MGIAELLLNASLEFFAEIFDSALQRFNRARRVRAEGFTRPEESTQLLKSFDIAGAGLRRAPGRAGSSRSTAGRRGKAYTSRRIRGQKNSSRLRTSGTMPISWSTAIASAVPRRLPALPMLSNSIGKSRCASVRKSVPAPPGCRALNFRPSRMPPA